MDLCFDREEGLSLQNVTVQERVHRAQVRKLFSIDFCKIRWLLATKTIATILKHFCISFIFPTRTLRGRKVTSTQKYKEKGLNLDEYIQDHNN